MELRRGVLDLDSGMGSGQTGHGDAGPIRLEQILGDLLTRQFVQHHAPPFEIFSRTAARLDALAVVVENGS